LFSFTTEPTPKKFSKHSSIQVFYLSFFLTDRSDKKAYYLVKTKTSFDFKMLINFDYHID